MDRHAWVENPPYMLPPARGMNTNPKARASPAGSMKTGNETNQPNLVGWVLNPRVSSTHAESGSVLTCRPQAGIIDSGLAGPQPPDEEREAIARAYWRFRMARGIHAARLTHQAIATDDPCAKGHAI